MFVSTLPNLLSSHVSKACTLDLVSYVLCSYYGLDGGKVQSNTDLEYSANKNAQIHLKLGKVIETIRKDWTAHLKLVHTIEREEYIVHYYDANENCLNLFKLKSHRLAQLAKSSGNYNTDFQKQLIKISKTDKIKIDAYDKQGFENLLKKTMEDLKVENAIELLRSKGFIVKKALETQIFEFVSPTHKWSLKPRFEDYLYKVSIYVDGVLVETQDYGTRSTNNRLVFYFELPFTGEVEITEVNHD